MTGGPLKSIAAISALAVLALMPHAMQNASAKSPQSASQSTPPDWTEVFPAFKIVGNVFYVGSRGLASYLITTPKGHILINSNLESSVPQIRDSVEKLGFHFSDVGTFLVRRVSLLPLLFASCMSLIGKVGAELAGGEVVGRPAPRSP
jgi:hypothetical protein